MLSLSRALHVAAVVFDGRIEVLAIVRGRERAAVRLAEREEEPWAGVLLVGLFEGLNRRDVIAFAIGFRARLEEGSGLGVLCRRIALQGEEERKQHQPSRYEGPPHATKTNSMRWQARLLLCNRGAAVASAKRNKI